MAQENDPGSTRRGRGRPPGRRPPFTSDAEAKAHLLQRGFTEEQLETLVEVGYYADFVSILMGAFKKDEPGTWLLQGSGSNLLLRNKPDKGEYILGMFEPPPPATVARHLGPLAEAFTVIARPVVLLIRLQEAVASARDLTRQNPKLWEAAQAGKFAEQFTAALILLTLEQLGWDPTELTETDHVALAFYIGIKSRVEGESTEQKILNAHKRADTWNRARARATESLLPLLRRVSRPGADEVPTGAALTGPSGLPPEAVPGQRQHPVSMEPSTDNGTKGHLPEEPR
jgi:hypothetical protein